MFGGILLMVTLAVRPPVYVSPQGNDALADGTLGKPFHTVQRAIEAAVDRGASTVVLRGGTYRLGAPLRFGPKESNLVVQAYGKEKPLLSGAEEYAVRALPNGDGLAELPKGSLFTSLYADGARLPRPRLPEQGFFTLVEPLEPTAAAKGKGWDRFRFKPGDIRPEWAGTDAEVLCFHIWGMSRLHIKSVEGDVVTFTGPTGYDANWAAFEKGGRYLVENMPHEPQPGTWRMEPGGLHLYGARPSSVTVPALPQLVLLDSAANVTFKGLTFSHSNWVLPPQGRNFPQAEADLPAAIEATHTKGLKIVGCEVSRVDGYGIELGKGCQDCLIEKCTLSDLGAGGIKIGTQAYEPDETKVAGHNTIKDNLIVHGGRLHPAGIGVWIGHSPYNTVEHNEIFDFYYTGISVGWSWGYGPSNAHHNLIARNHIHQIGQGLLSDMGGIYLLGVAPGTTVKENLIHDVNSFGYGGWAIYPDEGSSHLLIESNVCYRTKSPGFHQHYGKENVVRDNVFALGREAQVRRSREEEHLSFTFEKNVVYWSDAPLLDGAWSNGHYRFDGNVYWRADGKPIDFAGMTLDQWRANGQDVHSDVADPLFVDPTHGDFRLKAGSPLRKMGMGTFVKALAAWPASKRAEAAPKPAFPLK